jgi:ribose 5-phosphate isomerase A
MTKERGEQEKRAVAEAAVRFVKTDMKLGLGSGSTSHHFIKLLGERVRGGEISVEAVASSKASEALAWQVGIPLTELRRGLHLDLAVDGADEIAADLSLIKGGGGAHLREKVVAAAAAYFLVIGDSSKLVQHLGAFPVPVEVVPFAAPWVMDRIQEIGGNPVLRIDRASGELCTTDQQNYILDCQFGLIEQPAQLASALEKIPGIVAHGIFIGYARAAIVAQDSQVMLIRPGEAPRPLTDLTNLP